MKANLLIRSVCIDCKKPLPMTAILIEGRCYKCHATHERQPLLDEIAKLRSENQSLKEAHAVPGFFVVLRHNDSHLYRHTTAISARAEAVRLAKKSPGNTFFVLETSSAYRDGVRPNALVVEMPKESEENDAITKAGAHG